MERGQRGPGCPDYCPHIWASLSPNPTTQEGSLTAELGGFIAVVQAVVVPVAFPALLDAAVVLAGELPGLALRRGDVGRIGCQGGKHRQDFNQVTKCSFPQVKRVPTRDNLPWQVTESGPRIWSSAQAH